MRTKVLTRKDFNWTRWGKTDMRAAAEAAIGRMAEAKDRIKRIPAHERMFANTIWPYERAMAGVGALQCILHLLASVAPDPAVRQAGRATAERLHARLIDLLYDAGLYRAFTQYAARKEKIPPDAERLAAFLLRDYRRMGMALSAAERDQLKRNNKKLNKLTLAFQKNLNNAHGEIRLARRELAGLPDSYISGLRRDAKGRYIVTLAYPDIFPFLRYAKSDRRRREIAYKYLRRGGQKNTALLREALRLREQSAHLLGYRTYAHYALGVKMAKTPERVMKFIRDLTAHTAAGARKELAALTAAKRRDTGSAKAKLEYHDVAFYGEAVRRERFDFDSQSVREYFPLAHVLEAMFKIYGQLLSVRFRKLSGFKFWSPGVALYEVRDADRSLIGYFGLDMYPRPGKYGHMAAFNVMPGFCPDLDGHTRAAPVCFLVGNFPKPSAGWRRKNPSLLSHGEVDTLFHEFGHIMHFTLGRPRFASQNPFAVASDFVEMPSQMLENWTWDRTILKKISRHCQTGKPLPEAMINRMLAARNFLESYAMTRQMVLAFYDMLLHLKPPKTTRAINELMRRIHQKMLGIAMPAGSMFGAGFGHLMGEYDAGYYGYAWSKVYAADLFTRFEKEGVMSSRAGKNWRALLEKAATQDEMKLITDFLGRAPNDQAFLKQLKKK